MPPPRRHRAALPLLLLTAAAASCGGASGEPPVERPSAPANGGVQAFANGCYTLDATEPGSSDTRWAAPVSAGTGFGFVARDQAAASRFFLKASDLGTYLFYDAEGRYLVSEGGPLARQGQLISDATTLDDRTISGAEWQLEASAHDATRFQLKSRRAGKYLARSGELVDDVARAAVVALYPQTGCAEHPELSVDATGEPTRHRFDDGDVFGFVDAHSHIFTNFGFGGGGIFHGAPFHRLGVTHALPDCAPFHGPGGTKDLLGYAYDARSAGQFDVESLLGALITGSTPEPTHRTAGYPDFFDWPNAPRTSTHQTQYYRWLERAYKGGLRLVVQHATSNSMLCELLVGVGAQRARYSCNDMVAADRIIDETYNLERYIDAQQGGAGRGFLRIVRSPAEARAAIGAGKLALVLGFEVSNLFDCFSVPHEGFPTCDPTRLKGLVQRYYDRGVRAIFPVHKYDNGFSAGDGHRTISEIGNFVNSGQWSSFTTDCPESGAAFDRGNVAFGGLNKPRTAYDAAPPNDMSRFAKDPVSTLVPYLGDISAPPLEGKYCQSFGMTSLGESLLEELMARGMIVEIDHLPQRSYVRAVEILEAARYPAAATHGTTFGGRIHALGGISTIGLERCADPTRPGSMVGGLRDRVALIKSKGGYPAEGFGFDLNGFAGAPGPRFGARSGCGPEQTNPVTYPFKSYAGDVTFTQPRLGNRVVDFNTEGFVHVGMLPELIEDARRTGATDADLEPLFRSAEAYLRMWERAEERARVR